MSDQQSLLEQVQALQGAVSQLQTELFKMQDFCGMNLKPQSPKKARMPKAHEPEKEERDDLVYIVARHPRGSKAKWYWLDVQGEWIETSPDPDRPPRRATTFANMDAASTAWRRSPCPINRKGFVVDAFKSPRSVRRLSPH